MSLLAVFLRLGCTSFGGPVAHLGYFREEFVLRRRWLDDAAYADLVALCNFLPGPASSEVGMSIGLLRGGLAGALMAWIGFTLPSALVMLAFAAGFSTLESALGTGALHGLKIVAVAVVAQAVWGMGRLLCPDRFRATLAFATTMILLAWPSPVIQLGVIAAGGLLGWRFLASEPITVSGSFDVPLSRRGATFAWMLFFGLLIGLPLAAYVIHAGWFEVFDRFYRVGALVFGGGHVVLPLLRSEVVLPGWINDSAFLAGYGAAQAVPGPLFTVSAYLGSVMSLGPGGIVGGVIALCGIFLPGFLLVLGALPHWEALRRRTAVQSALKGINAVVVGLLLAAFYDPVWKSSIQSNADIALALAAFALLAVWKIPPLYVVLVTAAVGGFVSL